MKKIVLLSAPLLLASSLLLSACFKTEDGFNVEDSLSAKDNASHKHSVQNKHENRIVLATVNGEAITESDVQFVLNNILNNTSQVMARDVINGTAMHEKILTSLIASKAMKQVVQAEWPKETVDDISMKVQHYREELFVKEYLARNTVPQPVTTTMVSDYYANHLEEFGKIDVKKIDILQTSTTPTEEEREALLSMVASIKQHKNWQAYAEENAQPWALRYTQSTSSPGLLEPVIENAVKHLKVGESSDMFFVKGLPVMVRVVGTREIPAKPLSDVSADIRKKLAALQLKKAVKKAAENVVQHPAIVVEK